MSAMNEFDPYENFTLKGFWTGLAATLGFIGFWLGLVYCWAVIAA
jgi:hypothetical protein